MPDVIVIGGGFAGLAAGVALARAGRRVLVLEARGRLGGRAGAYQDRESGDWVDNGQHVLAGCYEETFRFLDVLGTAASVSLQPRLEVGFVDPAGRASTLSCPDLPSPWHLAAGVLRWSGVGWRDRLALARMRPALGLGGTPGRRSAPTAEETVYDWLVRHGQTPRLIEMLWEPLGLAALNQSIRTACAAPFVTVLARMFGGPPRAAALGLPRVSLEHLYAEPARAFIEAHGGEVRMHALARVTVERRAVLSIDVRGEPVAAVPSVVAAVPWFALGGLFRDRDGSLGPLLADAQRTASSPIVTVNLWLDRSVVDRPFIGLPGRVMQWVFDKRQLFGGAGTGPEASHLSLVSSGADEVLRRSNDALVRLAIDELRGALPAARQATLVRATVVREPQASFSLAPGQPRRPATATGIRGLWLAGDWVDTGLPATIESAVLSGRWAAEAVLGA